MGIHYDQLSEAERKAIGRLHAAGRSQRQIAAILCRHPSTISRELQRNSLASRHWPLGRYDAPRAVALTERRAAALAGLGVALLPEDSCVDDVRRGALVHLLPQWSTPEGIVHLVFTTTRGMLPAVRAFVYHFAQAFSVMRGRGRMLVPDQIDRAAATGSGNG